MHRQLAVWSHNHRRIFDTRFHTIWTCPYLAYSLAYVFRRGNAAKWAKWLHKFYRRKHAEEGRCTCAAELADVPRAAEDVEEQ